MCVSLSLILMLSLMISVLFVFASFLRVQLCCFGGVYVCMYRVLRRCGTSIAPPTVQILLNDRGTDDL